jgi:hypothetical protein
VVQGFRPRGKKTEGKGGKNPSVNTKNVAIWRQKKTTDSPIEQQKPKKVTHRYS